jgi:maltooligosyltrehalose trehalohydrolase
MLFQGQETGSAKPWRFFCDHDPELCKLVRRGRADFLKQFARLATPESQAALPDPSAPSTFSECILDPGERKLDRPCVQLHRDLLRIRRETACFVDYKVGDVRAAVLTDRAFCIRWWHELGDRLLLVNLGNTFREAVLPQPLLAPPPDHGWRVVWSSEHPTYGGHGTPEPFTSKRLAIPARCAVLFAPDRDACLRVDPSPPSGEKELPDL